MDCTQTQRLLDPYVDRELDDTSHASVDAHLDGCDDCFKVRRGLTNLSDAARQLRRTLPPGLELTVRSAVRADADARRNLSLRRWRATALVALAACLVVAACLVWSIANHRAPSLLAVTLVDQAIAGHVRSLMADHLFDVESSDQHTVKPWFAGRIDFSPDVRDFDNQGYKLVGGRLDYLAGRPVAALVYRHRAHTINAFTWPAADNDPRDRGSENRKGFHVLRWRDGAMNWCLVSDASESTLAELQRLLETHPQPPATSPAN